MYEVAKQNCIYVDEKVFNTITEVKNDSYGVSYWVVWTVNNNKFILSGETKIEELEKILKNIKN